MVGGEEDLISEESRNASMDMVLNRSFNVDFAGVTEKMTSNLLNIFRG